MAALNLAGKTSGFIKLKSPDVASNATVELPNKDGILATLDDVTGGGGDAVATVADGCIYLNNQTITNDYTFPAGKNGMSAGPIDVNGTVEVGDGTWTIVGEGGGSVKTVNAPAFSAYAYATNPTNVPIQNNTWIKIALNAKEFDTDNSFDEVTNYRFTPKVAGWYQISGLIGLEGSSGNVTRTLAMIRKNGAEFKFGDDLSGNTHTGSSVGVNALIEMNGTTDYLELWVYVRDGTAQYNASAERTYLQGVLVKPANSGTLVGGEPVTLESLGIPNHDKVTVGASGKVTTNGEIEVTKTITLQKPDGETYSYLNFIDKDRNLLGNITSDATSMVIEGRSTIPLRFFTNGSERMKIDSDGRVDITGSLYVNGTPKSLDAMVADVETKLADRDKIIDKLLAKVEALEEKLKKVK